MRSMANQLSLFQQGEEGQPALETRFASLRKLASRLHPKLRMGTSSWAFPGWRGIVYPDDCTQNRLSREGLRYYALHPLLRTVGIDRGFYAPIPESDLRSYADQLPSGFLCCAKAPAAVTSLTPAGGERTALNRDFLSAERFVREMLEPFQRAMPDHCGPFILQFPPFPVRRAPSPESFAERLDGFLAALPRGFRYAIEIRDAYLLTKEYTEALQRNAASHVYNYWTAMPLPGEQAEFLPPSLFPFTVVRLLLRPGRRYGDEKRNFAPFNRLVCPDEEMRHAVAEIVRAGLAAGKDAFVLVNNKAEGSAPLTIEGLAEVFVRAAGN
jgi:uncharacterized protein YecE (DUF72 family)